jgi:riboflavin biosynthesis pyrimidine reductase
VLLRAGLVDELYLLVHPILAGQAGRTTFFSDPGAAPGSHLGAEGRIPLRFLKAEPVEQGLLLLSYALPRAPAEAWDNRFA